MLTNSNIMLTDSDILLTNSAAVLKKKSCVIAHARNCHCEARFLQPQSTIQRAKYDLSLSVTDSGFDRGIVLL